jgi:hypothetical protein
MSYSSSRDNDRIFVLDSIISRVDSLGTGHIAMYLKECHPLFDSAFYTTTLLRKTKHLNQHMHEWHSLLEFANTILNPKYLKEILE